MGIFKSGIFTLLTIGTAYLLYQLLYGPATLVPLIEDEYWGPKSNQGKPEDKSIRTFKVHVDDKILSDLKNRLKVELEVARFTPPLEGVGFEYGFNSKFMPAVLRHWQDKYDWRGREELLNRYPNFKTSIGGMDVHFQHVQGSTDNKVKYKKTMPLLLLHGWPGSFVEYQKIIPLLSEPKNSEYNYELIIPSLPGYGFSSGASRPGLNTVAIANIFLRLMKRLGHEQFYVAGGDWGGLIATDLSTLYPDNVLGSHSTMCISEHPFGHFRRMLVSWFPTIFSEKAETDRSQPLMKTFSLLLRETGYLHIQATKPDTVGLGLSQSPTGLAAYILEKFSTWTNRTWINREDGGLLEKFTMDELLDNVMIYWVTNSITTSMRLYSEALSPAQKHNLDWVPSTVPTACLMLPEDLLIQPEFALRDKFKNLTQYTVAPKGGHFGAFEAPEMVASDILKFLSGLQYTKHF